VFWVLRGVVCGVVNYCFCSIGVVVVSSVWFFCRFCWEGVFILWRFGLCFFGGVSVGLFFFFSGGCGVGCGWWWVVWICVVLSGGGGCLVFFFLCVCCAVGLFVGRVGLCYVRLVLEGLSCFGLVWFCVGFGCLVWLVLGVVVCFGRLVCVVLVVVSCFYGFLLGWFGGVVVVFGGLVGGFGGFFCFGWWVLLCVGVGFCC